MLPTTGSTITAGDLVAVLGESRFQAGGVVVLQDQRVAGGARGHAGRVGHASVAAELPAATSRLSTWPW